MKNLLRTLIVLISIVTISQLNAWGQTYTMKKPVGEALNKELIAYGKQLFEPSGSLEYDISTYDLAGSFDDLKKTTNFDIAYKELQENELKKNPQNSILWNNLGNYYNSIKDKENTRKNFRKAYDFIDSTFVKDSSYFYSFRGILELNLGIEGGMTDLEKAIQVNPNDTLAIAFYPILLLNAGEFTKAKDYFSAAFEKSDDSNKGAWYVFYIMGDLFEQFGKLQQSENGVDQMRDKEYDEIIDFSRINAFYESNKTNQSVANAKLMADILSLYFKMLTFEYNDGKFKLKYTKKETLRLREIQEELTAMKGKSKMNEFSRLRNLAFLSFLQGKKEASIQYFEQAISVFPEEKRNDNFNTMNCYNALYCIYSLDKNIPAMEKELQIMIKLDEKLGPNVTRLCDMAKCYLQQDNVEELSTWLDKAFLASPTDYETLRLLIQYYFFYRENRNAVDEYFKAIVPLVSNEDQNYTLSIQLALYYLANGDATTAHQYIQGGRDTYPGEPCEQCDELEKKYIQVSK